MATYLNPYGYQGNPINLGGATPGTYYNASGQSGNPMNMPQYAPQYRQPPQYSSSRVY